MMEYTLEEDLPEEFKGGTLRLAEDEKVEPNAEKKVVVDEEKLQVDNKEGDKSSWTGSLIAPITQRITDTLRPNRSEESCTAIQTLQKAPFETALNFFTFRQETVDNAVADCKEKLLNSELDGDFLGAYLLTEINIWDSDKERLIIVTEKAIYSIKYDFIALKPLEHRKVILEKLDNIVVGDLVYPPASLVPRLNGLANGVTNVLQTCLFQGLSTTDKKQAFESFHPRDRNMRGVRLMWNKGKPLGFSEKWNPFNNDVPFCTLTSHPLFFHEECSPDQKRLYDMDEFLEQLRSAMGRLVQANCIVHHNSIVLQNYVGFGSLIHNRNALGFFKVRGKFSF